MESSLETYIMYMGYYEIEPPIYKNIIEKNIFAHTNSMPKTGSCIYNELLYLMR